MPLYEYACGGCEREFELLVSRSTTPACPTCGSTALTKLMSAASIGRGGQAAASAPMPGPGCGSCGDPRGPGACRMN